MTESVQLLGQNKTLVGIFTAPEKQAGKENPTIILLNSGLLHRVGPSRLYVKLARRMASIGFNVLRFDLAGLGDSAVRKDNLHSEEGAVQDIKEAMNSLSEKHGIQEFVLMGICSGARHSFRVACEDSRVTGAVAIEAFTLPTSKYYKEAYLKSLWKPKSWLRLLTGKSEVWGRFRETLMLRSTASGGNGEHNDYRVPPRELFVNNTNALVERGANLEFIFAAKGSGYFNYRKQYEADLAGLVSANKIGVKIFDNTDHLFTLVPMQERLIRHILDWADAAFNRKSCGHPNSVSSLKTADL